jgi:asparagine synthase (glutamine-hydrolysing)
MRSELIKAGIGFFSQTDTEVILAAYQYWGVKAFAKFNGMWAFAIYDSAEQSIVSMPRSFWYLNPCINRSR